MIMLKIKKFLPAVTEIHVWLQIDAHTNAPTHGHTHVLTRPITRFTTGIGPVVNN